MNLQSEILELLQKLKASDYRFEKVATVVDMTIQIHQCHQQGRERRDEHSEAQCQDWPGSHGQDEDHHYHEIIIIINTLIDQVEEDLLTEKLKIKKVSDDLNQTFEDMINMSV